MLFVKLFLKRKTYIVDDFQGSSMQLLGEFLCSDVRSGRGAESFINWLNSDYEDTNSNYCFLEKEGEIIVIGCLYSQDPYSWIIEISKQQLIEILQQFKTLSDRDVPEIIIIQDDQGLFHVEDRNTLTSNR